MLALGAVIQQPSFYESQTRITFHTDSPAIVVAYFADVAAKAHHVMQRKDDISI